MKQNPTMKAKRRPPATVNRPQALDVVLRQLNQYQAEVADWTPDKGHLRVVATAGAGKSFSIVALVARLLIEKEMDPSRLVVTTFTAKAGKQLQHRLDELFSACGKATLLTDLRVGTFHSLAYRDLIVRNRVAWHLKRCMDLDKKTRTEEVPHTLTLWNQVIGWKDIEAIGRTGLNIKDAKSQWYAGAAHHIRAMMNRVGSPEASRAAMVTNRSVPLFSEAWGIFEDVKEILKAWDFSDLLDAFFYDSPVENSADMVIVDESQDNSKLELELAIKMAKDSLVLVGDASQCIPAGQLIQTPDGPIDIKSVVVGDLVGAVKQGERSWAVVENKSTSEKDVIFSFDLGEHGNFQVTPDHICFAAFGSPNGCYLYLMYRHDMGYRIGVTRTTGQHGTMFLVRTQQETADRMWVLEWFSTFESARGREVQLSLEYRIPTIPFNSRAGMWCDEISTKKVFEQFGMNGDVLLDLYKIQFDRPNYFPKGKCKSERRAVNLVVSSRHGYEVGLESSDLSATDQELTELGFFKSKKGTWRFRKYPKDYHTARKLADHLVSRFDGYLVESLSMAGKLGRKMQAIPAVSLHPGMLVPVLKEGGVAVGVPVIKREVIYDRNICYDLEVPTTANFMVGTAKAVVHNCVFAFKSAFPEIFLKAEERLGADTRILPINYRSLPAIIDLGNRVIQDQDWSLGLQAIAVREGQASVNVYGYDEPMEEAMSVARQIQDSIGAGDRKHGDYLILCRTNAELGLYEAGMIAHKLPYVILGGSSYWKRREIKNFFAYLILAERDDLDALKRIRNIPTRYLGHAFDHKVQEAYSSEHGLIETIDQVALGLRWGSQKGAKELADLIAQLRALPWEKRTLKVLELLYEDQKTVAERKNDSDDAGLYHVIYQQSKRFDSIDALIAFSDRCAAAGFSTDGKDSNRITLSTVHRAKSLEWKHVYVSASRGSMPHWLAEDYAEEQRIFYVAVTRAEDALTLVWSRFDIYSRLAGPSPFLRFVAIEGEEA